MILITLYIYFTFWLFTWYTYKLIKDVSGKDQYWHIPQMIFLCGVYLVTYIYTFDWKYLLLVGAIGLQFPFIFNSGLNAYRRLPITHLNPKYDMKFWQTVVLFIIGLVSLILIIVKE